MQIEIGINPNCSEVVVQVCGVTKEIAKEFKEYFIEALEHKYNEDYLKDFASGIFAIKGKYCLNLFDYDGAKIPEAEIILDIARKMGLLVESVSYCSDPIDTDEQMEEIIKHHRKRI